MQNKMEIEVAAAINIASAMEQDLNSLEKFWPPSRRGGNAQRMLDSIKERRAVLEQCLRDALSTP